MAQSPSKEFSGLRQFLWPIHRHELSKLVPMLAIFFLICFNYSILKNLKDALVVTAEGSGAEIIPFLKVWVMLPCAVLITFLYSRLGAKFSSEKVFYIIVGLFLVYFLGFITLLYPYRETLHPHSSADWLMTTPSS